MDFKIVNESDMQQSDSISSSRIFLKFILVIEKCKIVDLLPILVSDRRAYKNLSVLVTGGGGTI